MFGESVCCFVYVGWLVWYHALRNVFVHSRSVCQSGIDTADRHVRVSPRRKQDIIQYYMAMLLGGTQQRSTEPSKGVPP